MNNLNNIINSNINTKTDKSFFPAEENNKMQNSSYSN